MVRLRGWLHPGSLAAGLVAGLVAAVVFSSSIRPAEAQTNATESPAAVVTYSSGLLTAIVPADAKDRIEEIHPFPGHPVFLVRTAKVINVYERRNGVLVKLLDILLDSDFRSVTFLDDQKTFIVHTKKSAAVFSVDRTVTIPKTKTNR